MDQHYSFFNTLPNLVFTFKEFVFKCCRHYASGNKGKPLRWNIIGEDRPNETK